MYRWMSDTPNKQQQQKKKRARAVSEKLRVDVSHKT
jgi:hypothetical protein